VLLSVSSPVSGLMPFAALVVAEPTPGKEGSSPPKVAGTGTSPLTDAESEPAGGGDAACAAGKPPDFPASPARNVGAGRAEPARV
jgi:hypothetical protein